MNTQKTLPDKVFRVDKKIVFKSTLPWAIIMSVGLLLLMHNFNIVTTLQNQRFWMFILTLWVVKLILDIWTILYDRIEFRGNTIITYFNGAKSGEILDFTSVKQKKTPYTNYLGFEYKEPKGVFVRYLLPYGHFNSRDLQAIMQEILRINPNIKLEDDLSKQIASGTYGSKVIDVG